MLLASVLWRSNVEDRGGGMLNISLNLGIILPLTGDGERGKCSFWTALCQDLSYTISKRKSFLL